MYCNFSISDDGKYVVYEACTNATSSGAAAGIILRQNMSAGTTDIINTNVFVQSLSFASMHDLSMSPDGRFVSYVAKQTSGKAIYRWDAQTGINTLVSLDRDGAAPAVGDYDWPAMSFDGQYVAFNSSATNLVSNVVSNTYHIYRRDLNTATTRLLDVDANTVVHRWQGKIISSAYGSYATLPGDVANFNYLASITTVLK